MDLGWPTSGSNLRSMGLVVELYSSKAKEGKTHCAIRLWTTAEGRK